MELNLRGERPTGVQAQSARLVVKLSAAFAAFTLLGGCGGQVISAGDVTVLVSEFPSGGMDAQGGGRLEVLGGCLGASGSVIVWPHGTRVVDDDPLTIEVPDNGTFGLGDEVQLGGGWVLEHLSGIVEPRPYEVAGVTVPAECAEHDIFLAR
jgi:hypothetical protein